MVEAEVFAEEMYVVSSAKLEDGCLEEIGNIRSENGEKNGFKQGFDC